MNISSELGFWAEKLLRAPADRPVRNRVDDFLAAFTAGLTTEEGRALAQLYASDSSTQSVAAAAGAIARQSECDDIELTSCVTPGAAVIPVALGYGRNVTPEIFHRAVCRGYESGIMIGRAIGGARALPKVWPTLLAAPVMAAVTVGFLRQFNADRLVHAMALALSGSNGRSGRPAGTPSGRWISFAQAVSRGVSAAEASARGFCGDPQLCSGDWWDTQAGHNIIDHSVFVDPVWPDIDETEYKPFPIARQAATAVEAFMNLLARGIDPRSIDSIEAVVPRMNVAMLSRPARPGDRTGLLCNLGFQLACAAFAPEVLFDPDRSGATPDLIEFSRKTTVIPGDELDGDLVVGDWPARLTVTCRGTQHVELLLSPELGSAGDHSKRLQKKWRQLLHGETRRDFFESVVNAGPGSHAMLWDWVQRNLAQAAQSGASA